MEYECLYNNIVDPLKLLFYKIAVFMNGESYVENTFIYGF